SFNHLVGAGEQRRGNFQAEDARGLPVDDQLELGGLLDRQVGLMAREAACTSRKVVCVLTILAGLTSTAIREALGSLSRSSSRRFAVNSVLRRLMPVRLPPGRARLATRPCLTGSSDTPNTMGIVVVAPLAASAVAKPAAVTITATCRRTSSAARSGSR